jgi:hypothetical protein
MEKFDLILMACKKFVAEKFSHLSAEAVGWLAIVFIHCATIPSILSLMIGLSDKLPSLDVVLFLWSGLLLMFIKSLIQRDMLLIITIGLGFFVQAFLLALVVFK